MEEVSSTLHLQLVELRDEREVYVGGNHPSFNFSFWPPMLGGVEGLPTAVVGAYGAAYEEHRLLVDHFSACFSSHGLFGEVPVVSVAVDGCKIEGEAWQYAQAR